MEFVVIARVKGLLGGEKNKRENILAANPAEARDLVEKRFPRAKELILYQLLQKGEDPECFGQEFSRK